MRLTIVALFCVQSFGDLGAATRVRIDVTNTGQDLKQFWRSTGFSPPKEPKEDVRKHLLSHDERVNIALIGAVPNEGLKQIRIHWLFDLLSYTNNGYNFTYLDELLDWMHLQHLQPGFELMGTPVGVDKDQIENFFEFWLNIVKSTATRYIGRYGLQEVKKWRFETWNEPDLKTYNTQNFTLEEYLLYITACAKGLRDAVNTEAASGGPLSSTRSGLKLGGPAGLFKEYDKHPLCWGLLEMCNSISDSTVCPLQYISFHKKGDASASQVLAKDLEMMDIIHLNYPRIRHMPIANDEADILTNWSLDEEWRGDARYAAMVTKVIIDHFKEIVVKRNAKIEVLSNDNAFLNYYPYYFTQRTLFARFQMNNTDPPHIQFIKKPVYTIMGLLSFISGRCIKEHLDDQDDRISVLASTSRKTVTVLLVFGNDTEQNSKTKCIEIEIVNLPQKNYKFVVYEISNDERSNPYMIWRNYGASVFPNRTVREQMRFVQEPYRLLGPIGTKNETSLNITLSLSLPAVALVHICSSEMGVPGRVTHLQAINVTYDEVLLIWKGNNVNSRCIRTFEIEFRAPCRPGERNPFRRVNENDVIFLSHQHTATGNKNGEGTRGTYRVRAVDYWDRRGKYSRAIDYL